VDSPTTPPPPPDKAVLQAEAGYICDPHSRDVEYWHQEHLEKHRVALEWTRQYAHENKWRERRQSFWRGVQAAWLRQNQQAILAARQADLHDMDALSAELYAMIKPKVIGNVLVLPVQARSYEGMLKAWIQLAEAVDHRREQVMRQMDPLLGQAEAGLAGEEARTQLPFSGDEMRRLAHNLLQARRERFRADLMIEETTREDAESGPEEGVSGVEGEDGHGQHARTGELDR